MLKIKSDSIFGSTFEYPRDRASLNAMSRSAYCLHSLVHDIINRNALIASTYLTIKNTKNKKINDFWDEQFQNLDIKLLLSTIMTEYWITGESFVYAELDETKGKWSRLLLQNPDYIIIKRTAISSEDIIMLRPDENLRRIVLSNKPEDMIQQQILNNSIVDAIKNGKNIPLDNFHISYFIWRNSPYEIRGASPILPLFNTINYSSENPTSIEAKIIISKTLFDTTYTDQDNLIYKEVIFMKHSQHLKMLQNWLTTKIVAPITKIQGFKSAPEITFNMKQFRKDLMSK